MLERFRSRRVRVAWVGAAILVLAVVANLARTPSIAPDDPMRPAGATKGSAREKVQPKPKFPAADASMAEWQASIATYAAAKNVVALQHIAQSRMGRDENQRARLLAETAGALASIGTPEARRSFDDLLRSRDRWVRLAAINAFVTAYPAERDEVLAAWAADPDPLIVAKASALRAALR